MPQFSVEMWKCGKLFVEIVWKTVWITCLFVDASRPEGEMLIKCGKLGRILCFFYEFLKIFLTLWFA